MMGTHMIGGTVLHKYQYFYETAHAIWQPCKTVYETAQAIWELRTSWSN